MRVWNPKNKLIYKKYFIYDFIAISNHLVTFYTVWYWKEKICKHLEILRYYVLTFFSTVPSLLSSNTFIGYIQSIDANPFL